MIFVHDKCTTPKEEEKQTKKALRWFLEKARPGKRTTGRNTIASLILAVISLFSCHIHIKKRM